MRRIDQYHPSFDKADSRAVADVVDSGWISEGKLTKEFEQTIAKIMGYRFGIATTSGTVAISLALLAVGVQAGDQVITPDFTFVGTVSAVKMLGAEPMFVDIKEDTFCIDYSKLLEKQESVTYGFAKGKNTVSAMVPVALNGRDANPYSDFGLKVIVDASQALGSKMKKVPVATLSFAPNKTITTGKGGMVLTDDSEIAEKVRRLKDHGRLDKLDFHPSVGFNFQFTDLQATLGLSQLKKLPKRIQQKRKIFAQYQEELKGLGLVVGKAKDGELLWNQDILLTGNRETFKLRLMNHGVETREFYAPLHMQPAYKSYERFPVTEKISSMGLWLPSSPNLTSKEVLYVCESIRKVIR